MKQAIAPQPNTAPAEIVVLVYELYGLTDEEIRIVEEEDIK